MEIILITTLIIVYAIIIEIKK